MAPSATNGVNGHHDTPKIMLYTNHRCPFAHRAHIALQELGLPFEETIIDLDTPRPQWYLDINPRGLVPAMKYTSPDGKLNEEIIYESAVVSQFLCDTFPSHLLPSSTEGGGALERAKINFFIDAWSTKLMSQQMNVMKATTDSEKEERNEEWFQAIKKEIEPLLAGVSAEKPYFGGSEKLTFAEVIVAPHLVRWYALAEDGEMVPSSIIKKFESLPNFRVWAKAVRENESVNRIYDGPDFVPLFKRKVKERLAKGQ